MRRKYISLIRGYRGLTLIETCLAIVIIGVGISASVALLGTTSKQNAFAAKQAVAYGLANNIRELMATVQYRTPNNNLSAWNTGKSLADIGRYGGTQYALEDLDGAVWGKAAATPGSPIDANGKAITSYDTSTTSLSNYSQRVLVYKLNKTDLKTRLADTDPDQGVREVTVEILYRAPGSSTDESLYRMYLVRFAEH